MQEYKFKAKFSVYLFWFVIISICYLPLFLAYLKNPNYIEFPILYIILCSLTFLYINSNYILIKDEKIIYKKLFSGKKEGYISDIKELIIAIDFKISLYKSEIIFKLIITGFSFFINLKNFSYEDISSLIKIVCNENKNIKLDKLSNDLKNNNFESIKKERRDSKIFFWIIFLSLILIVLFLKNI